ncbi:hypothetical protein P5673_025716 [Acropora cervicornis]|uniref:Uncharacterized protein n=1 Tax=Acropora cervicornis TaxID=6130 RepID=A0AAD9Q1U8_ACRCE|nr:hypothetical protein P5673_025716 [Acropora cervicornis]
MERCSRYIKRVDLQFSRSQKFNGTEPGYGVKMKRFFQAQANCQDNLLRKIADCKLSFAELKQHASEINDLQVPKTEFVKKTGCKSWKEAVSSCLKPSLEFKVKAFLNNASLNVTGYMEISVDPLGKSIFFNNVSLSVTGYMEISMDAF